MEPYGYFYIPLGKIFYGYFQVCYVTVLVISSTMLTILVYWTQVSTQSNTICSNFMM